MRTNHFGMPRRVTTEARDPAPQTTLTKIVETIGTHPDWDTKEQRNKSSSFFAGRILFSASNKRSDVHKFVASPKNERDARLVVISRQSGHKITATTQDIKQGDDGPKAQAETYRVSVLEAADLLEEVRPLTAEAEEAIKHTPYPKEMPL